MVDLSDPTTGASATPGSQPSSGPSTGSSATTTTQPSTGQGSTSTTGATAGSSASQASTFDTQPPSSQDESPPEAAGDAELARPPAWGQLVVIGDSKRYGMLYPGPKSGCQTIRTIGG